MSDDTKNKFLEIGEVAIRLNQSAENIAGAPDHEPFTDENKNIRTEQCSQCDALYCIAFSKFYGTKRSFQDLSDQLQLRLEEDHVMKREHRFLIPLRWSDPTRKRHSEQKS
jgi:hypothetical protein